MEIRSKIGVYIIVATLVIGDAGAAISMANNDCRTMQLCLLLACAGMILGGELAGMKLGGTT